jgi:uncharacterized protein involved in type VI secretion and phage assembly
MNGSNLEHLVSGTRDGSGAGDHDAPYVFGRLPRAATPFPFSTRELARLMVVRSRARDGLLSGDTHPDTW